MICMDFLPRVLTAAIAAAAVALVPTAAHAQEDGVTIDRGSPAAKEYALPIEKARRDAVDGGRDRRVTPGERSAPLFGAGVKPDASDRRPTAAGESATQRDGTAERKDAGATAEQGAQRTRSDSENQRSEAAAPGSSSGPGGGGASGGGSSDGALALLVGGAGVALIAGIGGIMAKRRLTPSSDF